MKRFISFTLFLYLILIGNNTLSAQDFIFTEIPNPPGTQFNSFVAQANGTTYLAYFDNYFTNILYEFDGENLTEVGGPAGYNFSFFLTEQDGTLYLAYNDYNYNQVLVSYDGTDFTVLGTPNYDEFLNGYVFSVDGFDYFTWFEFINFTQILRYVDGDQLIDVAMPTGFTFGNFIGELNGEVFVSLQDMSFNTGLYSFDGTDFTEVLLPNNTSNPFLQFATDDALYINLFDGGFNSLLYLFDGADFTEIEMPAGFTLGGFMGQVGDKLYFALNDINFNGTFFELDIDTWTEVPVGGTYQPVFQAGMSETAIYPAFTDDFFYTFTMCVVDDAGATIVENPVGFQYSQYQVDWEDGVFTRYFDEVFNPALMYFDTELEEVTPPDNLVYNNYAFELDDLLYFTFRDFNFNQRLYYLGEPNEAPTASDNTVGTLIETPYLFEAEDFKFADVDVDDTLAAIQIIEKPTAGILHLNGANIGTGDIIPADDLETLTYVPFNGGEGIPYDSLSFKVFDGTDFSLDTYKIYINVSETIVGTKDNPLAASLAIFPNPASDYINLEIEDYYPEDGVEIMIFNHNGRAIERRMSHSLKETFEVYDWASGIYIIVIRDGEHMVSQKVLIQ